MACKKCKWLKKNSDGSSQALCKDHMPRKLGATRGDANIILYPNGKYICPTCERKFQGHDDHLYIPYCSKKCKKIAGNQIEKLNLLFDYWKDKRSD